MTQQETLLIKQGFEFSHQDNSRTHYVKDLGGDGFTYLHIFLKPDREPNKNDRHIQPTC